MLEIDERIALPEPLTQFLANNITTTTSGLVFVPGTPYEVSAEAAEVMTSFAPRVRRGRAVVAH